MRHYEILANGCLPYFINIDKCPGPTMASFPKQLCLDIFSDSKSNSARNVYEKYASKFEEHFLNNNTTKAMSSNFIKTITTNEY